MKDQDTTFANEPFIKRTQTFRKEMTEYVNSDVSEMLKALETIGPFLPANLVDAILAQGEAAVPGLLEMLEQGVPHDEAWDEDDPRHFPAIHAALLLTEIVDPRALPVLKRLYRDDNQQGKLSLWLNPRLPRYGAAGLEMLEGIFNNPDIQPRLRVGGIIGLGYMAQQPDLRDQVISLLRSVLPPANEDGTPDYTALPDFTGELDAINYAYIEAWTWAAEGLLHARDLESRERILNLYEDEMLDDWVLDPDDFIEALEEAPADPTLPPLADYYRQREEDEQHMLESIEAMQEEEEFFEMLSEIQEQTGMSDDEMEAFLLRIDELTDEDGEVGEAVIQQTLLEVMSERGGRRGRLVPPSSSAEQALNKIGRNERVTIQHPETEEMLTLKFKHAQKKLDEGWHFVERATSHH